jgi:SAM-dependent methyltransferase
MQREIIHKGWDWTTVGNASWDEVAAEFLPVAANWAQKFHSMIDIGAGRGRHALYMNQLGLSVLAVDLSESGVAIIRVKNAERGGSVDARVADMTSLPAEDETFDCAVCFHVIYHTDYAGVCKAVGEIRRVLKPGGEVFVTFNSKENPAFLRGTRVDDHTLYKNEGIEENIPHTYLDMPDIEALMDGFIFIKVQKIQDVYFMEKPSGGVHYFVHARKTLTEAATLRTTLFPIK